jgi:alpha-mannosidase
MKPVKQKGQEYVGLDLRLEAILDAFLYNPQHRKGFQRNYKKGVYKKRFNRLRALTLKFWGSIHDLKLHACGVSHLDAAWLYPVVDTKERAYKTFYKAMEHCDEFPFLTFAQTTPQYYDWIKGYDPKMWDKLKQYIDAGRIEVTGGMWVEPDLDMPCGESLVRQRLYGQLFNLREFGKMPTMESLLDVFGFPQSLPQILLKSGATSFWTTKCSSSVPPAFFYWQGIDGSQIFTYQFYYNWDGLMGNQSFRKKARFPANGCEKEKLSSHMTNRELESKFSQTPGDYNHHLPLFYGLGDGGRGPLELEIMFADTLMQMHNGIHTSQHQYMEEMRQLVGDRYLVWDDEMFLHMHHGTKTTQIEVKHYHRQAELWANTAETLLTLLNLQYPEENTDFKYKKAEIFEMWRLILFNQFHDILPGSSIPDVYILAIKELKKSITMAQESIYKALACFSRSGEECIVYNPFNWSRSEYIYFNKNWHYFHEVNPLSIQVRSTKESIVSVKELNCITNQGDFFILENKYIRATINPTTGTLISLVHKATEKEFIRLDGTYKRWGSGLRVFYDNPRSPWKAWDIDKQYALHKVPVHLTHPAIKVEKISGEMCVEAVYQFLKSTARIQFSLFPEDQYVRIDITTEMKDPKLLVKYFIPLELNSPNVTSDIPYGVITRPRIKQTEIEKLKWETSMQKWLDVSDPDYGMCIMNNNRYGFSSTKKGIYLTLTRTAQYPGISPLYGSTRLIPPKERPIYTDMQSFTYHFALRPHSGTWSQEHLWQEAYNFNLPLILAPEPFKTQEKSTKLEAVLKNGMFAIDAPNIQIGTLKPSEWCGSDFHTIPEHQNWTWDRNSMIIRLIELEGKDTTSCILTCALNRQIQRVEEVNLLEMTPKPMKIQPNTSQISLMFSKFEIKTIRILLK